MSIRDTQAIWNLLLRWRDKIELVVVHCVAGISRSPAVAAAICKALGGDDARFFQEYQPNRYVYELLLATMPRFS